METRLKRLSRILLVLFGILALRLVQLQIIQGGRYSRLSDRNHIRRITLHAARGRVFDRNGRLIADVRPAFAVSAIPTELEDSTLAVLAGLLGVEERELADRVRPVEFLSSPVKISRNLDRESVFRIEENRFRLPGIRVHVEPVRTYPDGKLYCHVLGHLGEVNEEDLARDTGYHALDYVGRDGIETRYEQLLRGRDGYEYIEVDARGQEVGPLSEKRPVLPQAGNDLHLTVDHRLQRLAARLTSWYERAAVVGIQIATGDVLCLVSRPGFDPNLFTSPLPHKTWESLARNPSKPFFNRVTASSYPPGSVFKPIVALAALRQGVITPETRFEPCTGSFRYGNRTFRCWERHGSLDLLEAIAHSCNVYFYQLGHRLGLDTLADYCAQLRLGEPTGIDLPGEAAGNIPTREWLDDRYGEGKWTSGVMLNFAIGQGEILMTPLQLAVTYGTIASGGACRRPHLLARVDSLGRTIRQVSTRTMTVPFRRRDLAQVKTALERVVAHGTAKAVRLKAITIAGKTGTAQNPAGPDHAWFVGYAPAEDPEVVFAVIVENAGHGSVVAAPIVRQLIRTWFSLPDETAH